MVEVPGAQGGCTHQERSTCRIAPLRCECDGGGNMGYKCMDDRPDDVLHSFCGETSSCCPSYCRLVVVVCSR